MLQIKNKMRREIILEVEKLLSKNHEQCLVMIHWATANPCGLLDHLWSERDCALKNQVNWLGTRVICCIDALNVPHYWPEGSRLLGDRKEVEPLKYLPSNLPYAFNLVAVLSSRWSWLMGLTLSDPGDSWRIQSSWNFMWSQVIVQWLGWECPVQRFLIQPGDMLSFPKCRAGEKKDQAFLTWMSPGANKHGDYCLLQKAKEGEDNVRWAISYIQKLFCSTHNIQTRVLSRY